MKILVDADACPVINIVERLAKERQIPVILLCDTNHMLNSNYSEIIIISAGIDAVDFAILNKCNKNDLVVTQDYGLAALVLAKQAYAIHQSGKWYTDKNINQMLNERYIAKKLRNSSRKNHLKGPKRRTLENDINFEQSFIKLLNYLKDKENY